MGQAPDLRLTVERFVILVWVPSLLHCFSADYLRASRLAHAVSRSDPRLVVRILVPGTLVLRNTMFPPRFGRGCTRNKFSSLAVLLARVRLALAPLLELSTKKTAPVNCDSVLAFAASRQGPAIIDDTPLWWLLLVKIFGVTA